MKIKLLVIFISLFISSAIKSQNTLFLFQPNIINAATAGFFNKLSVNGTSYLIGFTPAASTNSSLNYNQKIKVLRGGIGATFNFFDYGKLVQISNGTVNYSYHLVNKDKFRLALGAGFSILNQRFTTTFPFNSYYNNTLTFLNFGTVAQFGNHTGQISLRSLNFGEAKGNTSFTAIYNYDWMLNDNFSIKIGALFFNQANYNNLTVSTILKYKMIWLNLGLTNRDVFTTGAGVDIKEKLRVGVFIDSNLSQLNNGSSSNLGFVLAYRIKNERSNKLTE